MILAGQLIFIGVTMIFLTISFFLYRTTNGIKPEFLVFFLALSWGSSLRVIEPFVRDSVHPAAFAFMVGVPILITGLKLIYCLWRAQR